MELYSIKGNKLKNVELISLINSPDFFSRNK